jgi:hypothetical protein
VIRKFSASSRLIDEVLTQYGSAFLALCELINNSIQAKSKNIWLNIDYARENELLVTSIKKIEIIDDGCGVHLNDIQKKLFGIGDSHKLGGKGIGRFGALQIGANVIIETVGFSDVSNNFSFVKIPITEKLFKDAQKLHELEIDTEEKILEGKQNSYYKVSITDLYDSSVTKNNVKRKITEKFSKEKISQSIFERYPLPIFHKKVKFWINEKYLNPDDYIIGEPINKLNLYKDRKDINHNIYFEFFNLKPKFKHIKVFLTTVNDGIKTIVGGMEYNAEWLSPNMGSWFVYIFSDTIPIDAYRNLQFGDLDEDGSHFKGFIKEKLNLFFKEKNQEFDDFSKKLKSDKFYPYKDESIVSSQSKIIVFNKFAYLIEEKYNLLNADNRIREIIYPLIDQTISNGELDNILKNILRLKKPYIKKFNELLEKSDLENVIEFSEKVARKLEDLEFLEKITYSQIAKHVPERKGLHKFLEKMLWIFGEQFANNSNLLSDRGLENNLKKLRDEFLQYKANKRKYDNYINETTPKIKSITDLFVYSEKIIDEEKREVLVVELKAPKVKISPKELEQVMSYAQEIESRPFFSEYIHFHIILIGTAINDKAKFRIKGNQQNYNKPIYFKNEKGNIIVSIMKWSDLIEQNKRRLKYLSHVLNIKDITVHDKIEKDFKDIELGKIKSVLRTVPVDN